MHPRSAKEQEGGFDEPIPMAPAAPGVVDLIQLYNQYAAQLRFVEACQRAVVCRSAAAAGVDIAPDAYLG